MDNLRYIIITLAYLVAAVLFIFGLRRLSHPATARSGNQVGMAGMALALVVTLFQPEITNFWWIIIGVIIGGAIGYVSAQRVAMTAMPQMVAIFNGAGGGAAALISLSEFLHAVVELGGSERGDAFFSGLLSLLIGSISFAGSIIAFGKLQGLISAKPITYAGQQVVNAVIGLLIVVGILYLLISDPRSVPVFLAVMVLALILGVAVVLPIGGADMPVVISLLNSFTGTAAALTGFVLSNPVLIVSGALVGASGMLLTLLMAKAMNRSVANVLFGAFGTGGGPAGASDDPSLAGKSMRETSVDDAATLMAYARNVIMVPGYGLAVAQAQHAMRELGEVLEDRGVNVKYAIHPVAGRMPGHMNVLLAEANVPYDQLYEMEQINDNFDTADVALVVGANDVVNPSARTNPKSPIYGMPILNADHAQNVIVIKRGKGTGFAGIENELFYENKTQLLYADARSALTQLVEAAKSA